MKIKNFLAMMLMALCVVACSDDDGLSPAESVVNTYKGYANIDCQYFKAMIVQHETIAITANEDGTAKVVYTSSSATWGITTISAATVTAGTNGYTIKGKGVSKMSSMQKPGETVSHDCELTATISTDKSEIGFVLTLPAVMGGTTITFYKGDAPDNLVVAGKYNSYSSAISSLHGPVGVFNDESITLTANTENGKVNLAYSGKWGKATASGLEVSKKDGSYTISGSGVTAIVGHGSTTATNYEFTVEGTISEDKKTASFVFKINMGGMGTVTVTTHLGKAPAAMLVAGVYNGTLDLSVGGTSQGSEKAKVTLKAQEDGKIELTLSEFGSGPMAFKEMIMKDVVITATDNICTVTGTINTTSGATQVTGSLTGTIENKKATIEFSLKPGAMPFPIIAKFVSE